MVIYVDLLWFFNVFLDFILLMTINVVLTRNIRIKRLLLASFIGGGSTFLLFVSINGIISILIKILLGLLMVIVAFGFKSIKYTFNNLFYLYTISFSIGGVLYLLMDYQYYNYGFILILFIVVCFLYYRQMKTWQNNYHDYYPVTIYLANQKIDVVGYLDTGNKLYDNYQHRPIILIDLKIDYNLSDIIYVSYVSLNHECLLKCLKAQKIVINKRIFHNYLVGISDNKFQIDGVNCILHSSMKGKIIC